MKPEAQNQKHSGHEKLRDRGGLRVQRVQRTVTHLLVYQRCRLFLGVAVPIAVFAWPAPEVAVDCLLMSASNLIYDYW